MKTNTKLTAVEIGSLWSQYMNDSMTICTLDYFMHTVQDQDVKSICEFVLRASKERLQTIIEVFNGESIPIPLGFTQDDVDSSAPPLYSDVFLLHFLKHLSKIGLSGYGLALSLMTRSDLRKLFYGCIRFSAELNERVTQTLLFKGLFSNPPYIPIPDKVEFVKSPSFLAGFLQEKRPLNALEIMHLYANQQTNAMGSALAMGLSQVARSKEVREFLFRGHEIAQKHVQIFNSFFIHDNLSAPATFDSEVSASTMPPFSDKLMMLQISALIATSMSNYGIALGVSTRVDLAVDYGRLMVEIAQYGEDGMHIMIKNQWFEQPPQAADRRELALQR